MWKKVLVANRGEIACRVLRTLRRMGIGGVAVYSEADANASFVRQADEAVLIGPAPVAESYLRGDVILAAARATGAGAIHPGYGFLSESADFATACEAAGVRFVGPTAEQIRRFGLKHLAREVAVQSDVPLLPGSGLLADEGEARREAARIGYPVMLKSTAGGGGIGLRICADEAALDAAFASVRRLGQQNFSNGGAYLEKYLPRARHVEVQIFGDGRGHVLALGDRDCSTQRRNQKIVEEAPAPGLAPAVRERLFEWATRLGRAVSYASAGTVEFVVDAATQEAYFLEVNTRLQVEHGVTEAVTGIDLVQWMLEQAAGIWTPPAEAPLRSGAAIEVRIYAEDPHKDHQPSTGLLTAVELPGDGMAPMSNGVRVDGWIEPGVEISPHYDPLLAKVITHGSDRAQAIERLRGALGATRIHGIETNLAFLRGLLEHPPFVSGEVSTRMLDGFEHRPDTIEVLDGGTQTTVQDWPGRLGFWAVGLPPSGPMDDLGFRLANRLVGNPLSTAGLEITLTGPSLRFNRAAVVALAGAPVDARLDKAPVEMGRPIQVPAGSTLKIGAIRGRGARVYLAVRGGLDVPLASGSRATFMLGKIGGHGGRALRAADVLRLGDEPAAGPSLGESALRLPELPEVWEIGVLYGPHGAPDFFTDGDIETFFATEWRVHYNSDRTGVRLMGPKPVWARRDGGEAGLHPSNIHDNAYAIGTVDFTGDMPIVLGPDGPSLGGFVCPATIVAAERWKMGQLKAGDRVRFSRVDEAEAERLAVEQARFLADPAGWAPRLAPVPRSAPKADSPILDRAGQGEATPSGKTRSTPEIAVVYRRAGDEYLLVEYGDLTLDFGLRLRAHSLMEAIERAGLPGIIDLTPGIRSLQIHHDPQRLPTRTLLGHLERIEASLPSLDSVEIPSRIVHLPLSWEDEATLVAIEKYMRVVRADAPWCPSNIEFIRRINGLDSVDDVRRIVFDASYLVLGLGDVYLGAPVATPLDPRHRLVTTKYNPARTWTPENAVGIGGAYLCIYGMEGPGGYQFVGRTVQMWNTHRTVPPFSDGKPWLLRFFDQIRFYPVSGEELLRMRAGFLHGRIPISIEPSVFSLRAHRAFVKEHAASIEAFKRRQQAAFVAERERWAASGQDLVAADEGGALAAAEAPVAIPAGCAAVRSPVAGSLWRILVQPGERIGEGDSVAIVEAMKTEIHVAAPSSGVVRDIRLSPGASVAPGDVVAIVEERD